ncbi:MAG: hypothetical protein JXR94_00095 [Candidatus Hydrogenedentes bacterium]|nr:hypothetical protein [Candidatus Hydrogenedentota bacterium]
MRLVVLFVVVLGCLIGAAGAVDLAPLDAKRAFTLTFADGLAADRPAGARPDRQPESVTIDDSGFHSETLRFSSGSQLTYALPLGNRAGEWTFWFWCGTDNIEPGVPLAAIVNGSVRVSVEFDENSQPQLIIRDGDALVGVAESETYVGGDDWRMYAIRRRRSPEQSVVEFVMAGKECGSVPVPPGLFREASSRLVLGSGGAGNAQAVSRYDNCFLYEAPIDTSVLATHYADQLRIARELIQLARAGDEQADDEFLYVLSPATTGNVFTNGSFEAGLNGWWMPFEPERRPIRETGTACPHGTACVRLSGLADTLTPYLVSTPDGGAFCLSFYAKGTGSSPAVTATVEDLDFNSTARETFPLSEAFQRYELRGEIPPDANGIHILLTATFAEEGAVWLDAVQLEPAGPSEYAPPQAALFLSTSEPFNAFVGDTPPVLSIERGAGTAVGPEARVVLEIFDVRGYSLLERDCTADLTGADRIDLILSELPRWGAFRAVVRYGGRLADEQTFSRIPAPLPVPEGRHSRYGGHYSASNATTLAFAQLIGSHWNRNHDAGPYAARWKADTRPADGRFEYRFDLLELSRAYGQELIATLDGPHDDVEAFGDDIYALVKGYKGELKYLEIFNEPTAVIPAVHYAELLKAAYARAKEADPAITILGLSTWDVVDEFTTTVVTGAGVASMDVFSAHFYNWGPTSWLIPDGNWGQGFRLAKLRAYLDSQGGETLPIWHTESGIYIDSFYRHHPWKHVNSKYSRATWCRHHSPHEGAIWIAQAFPVNFANAAQVYTYYFSPLAGQPGRMCGHSLAGMDGLRPAAVAYAISAHMLDYSTFVAGKHTGIFGLRCYEFSRDGAPMLVAWYQGSEPLFLDTGEMDYADFMGNPGHYSRENAHRPRRAIVNTGTGTPRYVDIPATEPRFLLDLEPRYFPGMTLGEFEALLPDAAS